MARTRKYYLKNNYLTRLFFVLCLAPNVVYVSGLSIIDCSSFCVLLPMLSTSLDCPYLIALRSVSCSQCCLRLWIVHTWLFFVLLCLAPNVVYVSGLSILDCSSFCVLLPMLSTSLHCPYLIALRAVSCYQCCLLLWIIHTWFLFVLCLAPNVVYVSALSILDCSSLCVLLPMLSVSLDCLSPVSCMANVVCVSGLS